MDVETVLSLSTGLRATRKDPLPSCFEFLPQLSGYTEKDISRHTLPTRVQDDWRSRITSLTRLRLQGKPA